MDQFAAIVSGHNPHAFWQGWFDFLDLAFDAFDNSERVLAITHDHNPADGLAASVQLDHPAPDVAAKMDRANVLDVNRRAFVHFQHDVLDVSDRSDVAASADVVLGCGDFERLSADIAVAQPDRVNDIARRYV